MSLPANATKFYGEDAEAAVLLRAAMMAFKLGEMTSSEAAEFAGISRVEFLHRLGQFGIPVFNQSRSELEHDRAALRKATGV